MTDLITTDDAAEFNENFWDLVESIPFGNSDFQIRQFVFKHCKQGRNYRQIILEMKKDAIAIKKDQIERKKEQAELNMKNAQIEVKYHELERLCEDTEMNKAEYQAREQVVDCEVEILGAEKEELELSLRSRDSLIKDAMHRLHVYVDELNKLGVKFTREQFEKEEADYWTYRLLTDAQVETLQQGSISKGTLESLHRMGLMPDQVTQNAKIVVGENKARLKKAAEDGSQPQLLFMPLIHENTKKEIEAKNDTM